MSDCSHVEEGWTWNFDDEVLTCGGCETRFVPEARLGLRVMAFRSIEKLEKERDAAIERAEKAEHQQGIWETTVECHRSVITDLETRRDSLRTVLGQCVEALEGWIVCEYTNCETRACAAVRVALEAARKVLGGDK